MFMNSRFSSRTVATISSLADRGGIGKRKEDYKWRKDMEEYENSQEFKRESMIRNIESRSRKRKEREEKMEQWKPPIPVPAKTKRERVRSNNNNNARQQQQQQQQQQMETSKKITTEPKKTVEKKKVSWRQRLEEEATVYRTDEPPPAAPAAPLATPAASEAAPVAPAAPAASATPKAMAMNASTFMATSPQESKRRTFRKKIAANDGEAGGSVKVKDQDAAAPAAPRDVAAAEEGEKTARNGDNDEAGTKKLKSDLDAMMDNMEKEMEAGKSKLAKLRERIRRAKGAIRDTDQALANAPKG